MGFKAAFWLPFRHLIPAFVKLDGVLSVKSALWAFIRLDTLRLFGNNIRAYARLHAYAQPTENVYAADGFKPDGRAGGSKWGTSDAGSSTAREIAAPVNKLRSTVMDIVKANAGFR